MGHHPLSWGVVGGGWEGNSENVMNGRKQGSDEGPI